MGRSVVRASQSVEQFYQFSLLGLLASGYFALVGSGVLDVPTVFFTGAGLLLRLLLITGVVRFRIDARWTAAATLLYFGFYPLDVLYLSREFIPATVHLICFLAVFRVLTAESNRDYFFVKLIAFLEVLAATLLSSSVNFFLFLTLFVVFGVATFCCSEIRRSSQTPNRRVIGPARFHGRLIGATAFITASIVLLTAGLFFLLPRTARAAFRSMVSERYHLPGFSNEITLGQIGELRQQSTPVMHVRVQTPNEKLPLKWRGSALSQFDGKRWYNPASPVRRIRLDIGRPTTLAADNQLRREGSRISYQVRVGPVNTDTLFFAGVTELLQVDGLPMVLIGPGDTFRTGMGSSEGRVYRAIGYRPQAGPDPDGDGASLTTQTWNEHLLLPGTTSTRVLELAQQAGEGATPLERARSIERYLRTRFGYTTELLSESVADPIDHFLFVRRKGHCEYFASAMAVMLRAVHIPSRVVTGFQSGVYNPMTGWQVIRTSDAHSWVEAWLPGRGWTSFDPTPPDTERSQGIGALRAQLLLYLDTAETLWRDWVIGYNLEQQLRLMTRVERSSRVLNNALYADRLRELTDRAIAVAKPWIPVLALLVSVAILLAFAGPRIWKRILARQHEARIARGRIYVSDAAVLYSRMLDVLRHRGLEKPAWLTPGEFAHVVPESPTALLVEQITTAYHDLRYGGDAAAGLRMVQLLQELETCK